MRQGLQQNDFTPEILFMNNSKLRHPLTWVPTLYFAEGLPLWVVLIVAGVMFKSMGVSNQEIGHWTGILVLAC